MLKVIVYNFPTRPIVSCCFCCCCCFDEKATLSINAKLAKKNSFQCVFWLVKLKILWFVVFGVLVLSFALFFYSCWCCCFMAFFFYNITYYYYNRLSKWSTHTHTKVKYSRRRRFKQEDGKEKTKSNFNFK